MEDTKKRALRRHHLKRIKQNRSNYYSLAESELDAESKKKMLGRIANTAKLCSCWACGNPRKHSQEKTVSEISAAEFMKLFVR